jgi:hypothetical protein
MTKKRVRLIGSVKSELLDKSRESSLAVAIATASVAFLFGTQDENTI